MKRKALAVGAVASGLLFISTTAGAVLSGASQPSFGASAVTWNTPESCGQGVHPCNFLLCVNEPFRHVFIGDEEGTGTLSVAYPDFCGTIQADVFFQSILKGAFSFDGKNWDYAVPESNAVDRKVIDNCAPPTTTTTTSPVSTTTTTTVPPPTTTTLPPAVPPSTGCLIHGSTDSGTDCPVVTPPNTYTSTPPPMPNVPPVPPTVPAPAPYDGGAPTLPFTGISHFWSLLWGGLCLVCSGLLLLKRRVW